MSERMVRTYVSGHRNPDVDSVAAAVALAELRRRHEPMPVIPICPGVMPERAQCLFRKFSYPMPESRYDLYLRAADLLDDSLTPVVAGTSLFEAVKALKNSRAPRLPVVDAAGKFLGMLSPLKLLSQLLEIGDDAGSGLTGRNIHTSIDLIAAVIGAEAPVLLDSSCLQTFKVYVAAMGVESFEAHLPAGDDRNLVLIVGDRSELHLRALQRKIRLLIVTGDRPIEPLILREAANCGVSILRTELDSATVIRRLKFSMPVEFLDFLPESEVVLNASDRITACRKKILGAPEDAVPVVDRTKKFLGVIYKNALSEEPPVRAILVDHNEVEQSLPGIEDLPVVEIVDHHRLGMMSTDKPIKFTGDVVGSTCTLIASMFKGAGESIAPDLAGILLGGIVSDTLDFKSPTTVPLDIRMGQWLEKISGVTAAALMAELSAVDSPLVSGSTEEVVEADRKNYQDGSIHFSLSQVEETKMELFHQREVELRDYLQELCRVGSLDFAGLMVTDAVRGNSELLICGKREILDNLPWNRGQHESFLLPGVLSRKKQLLPQILAVIRQL